MTFLLLRRVCRAVRKAVVAAQLPRTYSHVHIFISLVVAAMPVGFVRSRRRLRRGVCRTKGRPACGDAAAADSAITEYPLTQPSS